VSLRRRGGVRCFQDEGPELRPHARSATVGEITKHQLLSERRFFSEVLDGRKLRRKAVCRGRRGEALAARLVSWGLREWSGWHRGRRAKWVEHVCFLTWSASGSGCFGGGCCTRHIIGRS